MCVISTSLVATGLGYLSTSLASSAFVVGSTTVLANAALGAGLGAGMTAITGSNNWGLGIGLGALGGALGSGLNMAVEGIDVMATTAAPTSTTMSEGLQAQGFITPANAGAYGTTATSELSVAPEFVASQEVNAFMQGEMPAVTTAQVAADAAPSAAAASGKFLGLTASQWLSAGGSVAASGATGVMQYRSAKAAAEAQAEAQAAQAQQEKSAADQSRMAAAAAAQNAENARVRAGMEIEAGELQASDAARAAHQERGAGLAKVAASGVMVEPRRESVSTMYEADQRAELAYDQAKIMQNAEMRAWGYEAEARVHQLEAAGNLYAAKGHDVLAASLDAASGDTLRYGKRSAIASGIAQGVQTGLSVRSLLS